MKKKEFETFKSKSSEELKKLAQEYRDKLWQLRIDLVSGKVKNVREANMIKKNIARINTLFSAQSLKQN